MEKLSPDSPWSESPKGPDKPVSWAFQLALCLLGPLFFLSYVFSILAPFPALYLLVGTPDSRRGRLWSAIALIVGGLLCFAIKGWVGSLAFFLLSILPALVLGELLLHRQGPEKAVLGAVLALALACSGTAWLAAQTRGLELIPAARQMVETNVKSIAERLLAQENHADLSDPTQEELQTLLKSPGLIFDDLAGLLVTLLLLLCTLPCVALIRWNPKGFLRRTGIARDFLRKWQSPEWLVWPALFCGAFLVFEVEYLSAFARNLLKPILLIYFFQGMSILAYFLDSLRLRGPIRVLFYGAGVLFLTPMVVSFGFFDLWFNFRSRKRLEEEDKES
jgi:Predicted membrane protein (DUF2232)